MPIGSTTVENLLRVARSDAGAGTAFAAFGPGGAPQIVAVPEPGATDGLSTEELAELVHQAVEDPEYAQARVFVRSVQMGRALTLAVAPLLKGSGQQMIGLVAERDHAFGADELEVLEQLAERLSRHLEVVRQMNGVTTAKDGRPGDAPERSEVSERARPCTSASLVEPDARWTSRSEPDAVPSRNLVQAGEPPFFSGAGMLRRRDDLTQTPASTIPSAAPRPASSVREMPSPSTWWTEADHLTGLPSLAQFFSRAGRLLTADARSAGSFALVVVEVPEERTAPIAARVLTKELRFNDPVARVDGRVLAAALVLLPARTGDAVERRLAAAVRAGLDYPAGVRTAHVVVEPNDHRDVDELLRDAVLRLRDG